MTEASLTFSRETSMDTPSATSLPGLEDGLTSSCFQGGQQMSLFGQQAFRVSRSVSLENRRDSMTTATYGHTSESSLGRGNLQSSLENKLQALLEKDGSTLYPTTLKRMTTNSGRPYSKHALVGVQRSGKGSIGLLPALSAREGRDWSRGRILASLDNGSGVAKRICAECTPGLLSEEICGLNPSFGAWMMGFPEGWHDCMGTETQ